MPSSERHLPVIVLKGLVIETGSLVLRTFEAKPPIISRNLMASAIFQMKGTPWKDRVSKRDLMYPGRTVLVDVLATISSRWMIETLKPCSRSIVLGNSFISR
jgi:hypothetical protein